MTVPRITEIRSANQDILSKFPLEKKDQVITYIMVGYPKYAWNSLIWDYMLVHNITDWEAGYDFYLDTIGKRNRKRLLFNFVCIIVDKYDKENIRVGWIIEQIKKRNITSDEFHTMLHSMSYPKLITKLPPDAIQTIGKIFDENGLPVK